MCVRQPKGVASMQLERVYIVAVADFAATRRGPCACEDWAFLDLCKSMTDLPSGPTPADGIKPRAALRNFAGKEQIYS